MLISDLDGGTTMSGPWRLATILLLLAPFAVAPAASRRQSPVSTPPPQQPFRGRVDVVSVDAFVTDKLGQFVTDLTTADFEIKERGKLQSIDTFKFVRLDQPAGSVPTLSRIGSDQDMSTQAARDDVRLFVVFLDDYHVQRLNSEKARDRIARLVSEINPRDLVAIMYPTTPVDSLAFSHDRAEQVNAIKRFVGRKYDYDPMNQFEENYKCALPQTQEKIRAEVTYSALATLSAHLGALTDRRKTVIDVSEGPTGSLPPWVVLPQSVRDCAAGQASLSRAPSAAAPGPGSLQPAYIQAAIEHNVAIYTVDPRGTTSDDFDLRNTITSAASSRTNVADAHEALRNLAAQTGGRAIVNVNEYDDLLQQVLRDSSAYYLLGYTSNLAKHDGQFHEISVRVKRPGVDVRARPGYWALDDAAIARAAAPKAGPPAEIKAALDTLLVSAPDAAVRMWTGATRGAAGKTDVTVVWEATAQAGAGSVDHVTLKAASGSGDSYADGDIPSDHGPGVPGGQVTFAAAPGLVTLRVVALDANGGEVDTERREVVVPDFTGTAPLVSTPLVFVARTPREMQLFRAAAAPRPATSREFTRTDRLLVRFAVFGPGGVPPIVTMRVLRQNGQPLGELPAPVVRADGRFDAEVGLAWMAAGAYLIEVRASGGTEQASALVPFRIDG
jgi:VWFA-related protein